MFSLTDEGLDDVAECIARAFVKEKKRAAERRGVGGRASRQRPAGGRGGGAGVVQKPSGPQMPKIPVSVSRWSSDFNQD